VLVVVVVVGIIRGELLLNTFVFFHIVENVEIAK
jgi:hypothetical protein